MSIRMLWKQYGLSVKESFSVKGLKGFGDGRFLYFIIPVYENQQEEIVERFNITRYFHHMRERFVPFFQPTRQKGYIGYWEDRFFVVLRLENWDVRSDPYPGKRLAEFHLRGMSLETPVRQLNRTGKWKELWERRQQQLETLWQNIVRKQPNNEFENMFVESFSYYSGLSENAMQYFADTLLDGRPGPFDRGTVCHERFTKDTWSSPVLWKNPFDWVVDHPSRDLAEWARNVYFDQSQSFRREMGTFFSDYQQVLPLSPFSWRLFYSRLLFPVHYIECVETYFSVRSERLRGLLEERLRHILASTGRYERFLAEVFDIVQIPVRSMDIPPLDWLK